LDSGTLFQAVEIVNYQEKVLIKTLLKPIAPPGSKPYSVRAVIIKISEAKQW
jgi:hypothetical protein